MRTDATRLCRACVLRTAEPVTCPRCGGPAVPFDRAESKRALTQIDRAAGTRAVGVHRLIEAMESFGWGPQSRWYGAVFHRLALACVLFFPSFILLVPAVALFDLPPGVHAALLLAMPVAGVLGLELYWRALHERVRRLAPGAPGMPRVELLGTRVEFPLPALPAAAAPAPLVGRVRARAIRPAPLSGRSCVAFRVVGRVGRFDLDDAAGEDFDLELADGSRVPVPLAHAALELHVGEPAAFHPTPWLVELLRARHVPPAADAVLAEAFLVDGDQVTVSGPRETRAVPDGFRGTRYVDEPRGRPDAPLVIRRA